MAPSAFGGIPICCDGRIAKVPRYCDLEVETSSDFRCYRNRKICPVIAKADIYVKVNFIMTTSPDGKLFGLRFGIRATTNVICFSTSGKRPDCNITL